MAEAMRGDTARNAKDGMGADSALEVEGLAIEFRMGEGAVCAVNDFGFRLRRGEILGVVGESGSGKSVAMLSLLGLLPMPPARIVSGSARLCGCDLLQMNGRALQSVRGRRIGMVFQDPMTSLNPVFTVGYQLMEPLRAHLGLSRRAARQRAIELLELVGIPSAGSRIDDYPNQFSGGMRQRVMIAIAIACEPEVLIADEPTTALDVTIQAQILDLIHRLREELGMAILWITHDLGVVAGIADRVMVMYGGTVVEQGTVRQIFAAPRHPYTQALLKTLPALNSPRPDRLASIAGQPPVLTAPPASCTFAPRCAHAHDRCLAEMPPMFALPGGHESACWLHAQQEMETGHA